MNIFKVVITALFPNTCAGCGAVLSEEEFLCDYCYEMLDRTAKDKLCFKCGLPKKKCDCSKYIFRFDGCTAPFYNNGTARKAMYAFKFRRKERFGEFFARQMALCVKQAFCDVKFDIIGYVPMLKRNEHRRGYNQSKVLARALSEILGIPVAENLLGCKGKEYTQHELPHKMRFNNVKDRYYCNFSVNGKNILLVDDIKTTGATLDECAKQLLKSGADRVYCVTGLITKHDNKRKE